MNNQSNSRDNEKTPLEIVYYTDPLCCWSWAFEPQWRRLRHEFEGQISWRYCMGGLLPNWETFSDPMNAVSRPLQMGPLWFEAKHISGMPINERIWIDDPPASSYPGCMAVKCAGLQSTQAEEAYLRALREAVMVQGKNIAKQQVLIEVAARVAACPPGVLDLARLEKDLKAGAGTEAFRNDLLQVHYHKVSRFPTLTMVRRDGKGVMITGYRPYNVLLEALAAIAPDLQPIAKAARLHNGVQHWSGATQRELAELAEITA